MYVKVRNQMELAVAKQKIERNILTHGRVGQFKQIFYQFEGFKLLKG